MKFDASVAHGEVRVPMMPSFFVSLGIRFSEEYPTSASLSGRKSWDDIMAASSGLGH